jgi:hypothetical protein
MASLSASVLDLGLDEHREVIERLLPAKITGLDRDGRRQAQGESVFGTALRVLVASPGHQRGERDPIRLRKGDVKGI